MCCKQASLFCKTNKYFHLNKNNTGYQKALSLSLACVCASFVQPQSKCLLLFKMLTSLFSGTDRFELCKHPETARRRRCTPCPAGTP
jgi:hypothetical protein